MNVEQQRSELKRWRDVLADSPDCPLKENLKVSNKRYIEDHFPDEELGTANAVMKFVVPFVTESVRADGLTPNAEGLTPLKQLFRSCIEPFLTLLFHPCRVICYV